jgi:hypothetical protein
VLAGANRQLAVTPPPPEIHECLTKSRREARLEIA